MAKKSDFLARLEDTIIDKLENADLKELGRFVMEEGLYLALMANLFLVSGRVRAFEGTSTVNTPLGAQRLVMWETLRNIRDMSMITIAGASPFGWATPILNSWEVALINAEIVDGVTYYIALPKYLRMFMVLGLPGILRIAVQLTRQLIQLVM